MRNFIFLLIISVIVLQSCDNANASQSAKESKNKTPTYTVYGSGYSYKDIKVISTDSTGCIIFHIPEKKGTCGCSGTPARDVKVCGSYSIETTME